MFSFSSAGFLFHFFVIALDFIAGLSGLPFLEIIKNVLHEIKLLDCLLVPQVFRRNIITNTKTKTYKMKGETQYYIHFINPTL